MKSLVFMVLAIAAPVPKDAKPVQPAAGKLDGVWKLTDRESRGKSVTTTPIVSQNYTLVISGGEYVFRTHAGTIAIDADKKTIDMKVTTGPYKDIPYPGLFERTGDTLKVALPLNPRTGVERPAELKTGAQTTYYVYTFELDKTATAEQVAAKLKDMKAAIPSGPGSGAFQVLPRQPTPAEKSMQETLDKILEKLEKIEKRLDELEKKK